MTWADWIIVFVMLLSVIVGIARGFFRTACSLIGLLFGLTLAAWHYQTFAAVLLPVVRIEVVADAIAFFAIAIVVGVICNLIGALLGRAFDGLGLGCIDNIGGAILGYLLGAVSVTLGILVTVAFFPHADWLNKSMLPRHFFAACRMFIHMSPEELADRIRSGLLRL